jgi:hypothetical protein
MLDLGGGRRHDAQHCAMETLVERNGFAVGGGGIA